MTVLKFRIMHSLYGGYIERIPTNAALSRYNVWRRMESVPSLGVYHYLSEVCSCVSCESLRVFMPENYGIDPMVNMQLQGVLENV